MGGDYISRVWRSSMGLAQPSGLAQLSGLAQPHGSGAKVEPAGLGSGAKVQSPATLLWGLTPATPPATEDFTLGPDPSKHSSLLWGLTPAIPPATEDFTLGPDPSNPSCNRRLYFGA